MPFIFDKNWLINNKSPPATIFITKFSSLSACWKYSKILLNKRLTKILYFFLLYFSLISFKFGFDENNIYIKSFIFILFFNSLFFFSSSDIFVFSINSFFILFIWLFSFFSSILFFSSIIISISFSSCSSFSSWLLFSLLNELSLLFSLCNDILCVSPMRKVGKISFWTKTLIFLFSKYFQSFSLSINNIKFNASTFISLIEFLNTNKIISNNSFSLSKIIENFSYVICLIISESKQIILFCKQGEISKVNK